MLELVPGHAALSTSVFRLAPGLVWEPLSDRTWAVFSGSSGETHLLNESGLCVLEALSATAWRSEDEVVAHVASATGSSTDEIKPLVAELWRSLADCGVVLCQEMPAQWVHPALGAHAPESVA
jgi:hypothetical protein